MHVDCSSRFRISHLQFKIDKMEVSQTNKDFDLECSSMDYAEVTIDVDPSMNTFEVQ